MVDDWSSVVNHIEACEGVDCLKPNATRDSALVGKISDSRHVKGRAGGCRMIRSGRTEQRPNLAQRCRQRIGLAMLVSERQD